MTITARINHMSRDLKLFAAASLVMGIAFSLYDSTFNNFVNERFLLTGLQRSFLELPRELPGVLAIFVSAMLSFLGSRRLGTFALVLGAVGALLIGYASSTYAVMTLCLLVYSLGSHLFLPLTSSIGMELARGVMFHGRSRYEIPWQEMKTIAQCRERLEESRRMRLASLEMWPKPAHLELECQAWTGGPMVNAVGRFVLGLMHDDSHLPNRSSITLKPSKARSMVPASTDSESQFANPSRGRTMTAR